LQTRYQSAEQLRRASPTDSLERDPTPRFGESHQKSGTSGPDTRLAKPLQGRPNSPQLATPRVHFALPRSSNVLGQHCYFVLHSTGKPYWIANCLENKNSKERFPNGPSNELFRRFSKTS
ncbi:hypothetical protein PCASD_26792, partial [Puccinia coronata f. sp. avenae]